MRIAQTILLGIVIGLAGGLLLSMLLFANKKENTYDALVFERMEDVIQVEAVEPCK